MKQNKKLLVFLLSLCLLIGALALAAFAAEGGADVLTLKYQDGTVQTYKEGDAIAAPAVPKDFIVYEGDKAYKYTVAEGAAWEGIPAEVTSALIGQTLNVTVAGTKDPRQVYYVTEETLNGETVVVYHMTNDVHTYFSTSNTGDKGDGTNTGARSWLSMYLKSDMTGFDETNAIKSAAYSYEYMLSKTAKSLVRVTLYADVNASSFALNWFGSPRVSGSLIPAYLDLNGHTVTTSQTSNIDGKGIAIRIYSSKPGAHWYQTASAKIYRANDDATMYIGNEYLGAPYADNISIHCQGLSGEQWGVGMHVIGGHYYQTKINGDGGLLNIYRRIGILSDATFYSLEGSEPIVDKGGAGHYKIGNGGTVSNCTFYAPTAVNVIESTNVVKLNFENCTFVNVVPKGENLPSGSVVGYKDGNVTNVLHAGNLGTDAAPIVCANRAPIAIEGLVAENGTPIEASAAYQLIAPASTLKITADGNDNYYVIGTPFNTSAGDYFEIKGEKLYKDPEYIVSGLPQIVDGVVAEAGAVTLETEFTVEDVLAFTYLDTVTDTLYAVGYKTDCGETPEGVFEKFYEIFYAPASAYTITMYRDMTVNKSLSFGRLYEYRELNPDGSLKYNRDYYHSLPHGSITWDINGTTVTVVSNCSTMSLSAANSSTTPAIFGLEGGDAKYGGGNTKNTLKVTSSKAGGKFINNSGAALFGVAEGSSPNLLLQGENLTVQSKGLIFYAHNSVNDLKHVEINGGIYIYTGGSRPFILSGGVALSADTDKRDAIKNATVVCTANVSSMIGSDMYRTAHILLENNVFVAPNNAPLLTLVSAYNSGRFDKSTYAVKDCVLIGVKPVMQLQGNSTATVINVAYSGINAFSTEENLALAYASAPAGTAKYTFSVGVPNAEGVFTAYDVYGYAAQDQFLTVTYTGAGISKNYLVGKYLAPIAMDPAYYTVIFDFENGTANIPETWDGINVNGIVAAAGAQTATPAENNVSIAFALYDNVEGKVISYAVSDSDAIASALASALAAQVNAGKLYVYEDLTAGALTVNGALEILLEGKTLTLGGSLTVNAALTVQSGTILSAAETPFVLAANVALNGTSVYLQNATVVFGGTAGNASLVNVDLFNLASASMVASGVTATYDGGRVTGVSMGAGVTASGELFVANGTLEGAAFGAGAYHVLVNQKSENVTVLGETYTLVYVEAVTEDASKAIDVTYVYEGIVRGQQSYYYGSIPSFYRVFTEGYYFAFDGVNTLIEDKTFECSFFADEDKLQAQIALSDSLAYTFYLKVEAAGILENLKLNGAPIDFASLEIKNIEGTDYYVIPAVFGSFSDAVSDFILSVDLNSGSEVLTVTANAALDTYIGELLAKGTEEEATKAYAVAEYISALIEHFGYSFAYNDARAKNLGNLNNLLADYEEYRISELLPEANEALASAYIKSVSLVANEKVTFAFRIADGFDGTVEVNGVAQAVSQPFAGFERDYVLAAVALADLDEAITVTVKAASGETLETFTYTLADYVAGTAAQNEGATGAYAKALWNLAAALG